MNLLLDTCVLSEFAAKQPNQNVISWLSAQSEERLYLCSLTIGELKRGIERLPASHRRQRLEHWLAKEVVERFDGRIVSIDTLVMLRWGVLRAQLDAVGRSLPPMDSLIAAVALAHNLQLVTRNTQDSAGTGVEILDPW